MQLWLDYISLLSDSEDTLYILHSIDHGGDCFVCAHLLCCAPDYEENGNLPSAKYIAAIFTDIITRRMLLTLAINIYIHQHAVIWLSSSKSLSLQHPRSYAGDKTQSVVSILGSTIPVYTHYFLLVTPTLMMKVLVLLWANTAATLMRAPQAHTDRK